MRLDRRRFLRYVGAGTAAFLGSTNGGGCSAPQTDPRAGGGWLGTEGTRDWDPPPYPVPLPGDPQPASADAARLAEYRVVDDLLLPRGFRYDIVARWDERFGPDDDPTRRIRFGYNNDYTGIVPIAGSDDEYWLFVNHEYVSPIPWQQAYRARYGEGSVANVDVVPDPNDPDDVLGLLSVDGWLADGPKVDLSPAGRSSLTADVVDKLKRLAELVMDEVGISVLRARRLADGRFEVVRDAPDHRRIAASRAWNVAGAPEEIFRFTGPTAAHLSPAPRGTLANCSGGTTPWGTFLTCEENFQDQTHEEIDPAGEILRPEERLVGGEAEYLAEGRTPRTGEPVQFEGMGFALDDPLDGREYGWVCEIDPATGAMKKHTALGRFRHENIALRCDPGKRLAAYMGDDRRGGHVWKFVSDEVVDNPADRATSRLLENGTLYVARFRADYFGEWIPVRASTPLRLPEPHHVPSHHIQVPARPGGGYVGVGDTSQRRPAMEVEEWRRSIESFAGKQFEDCTLADLVRLPEESAGSIEGVLLMDAFAMANAIGATPTARPEDLEVHPVDRTVYVAFTDATDGSDGSPDRRIFPDSDRTNSRQYGAVYRILEDGREDPDSDPAAERFAWGKFVSSGEVADGGGGFAFADNLAFDPDANLWIVTDITTSAQNFPTLYSDADDSEPGEKYFPGVFGNNAMFVIPTSGPRAGTPLVFAIGPVQCELCGPTFTEDGRTLVLSVQHPGAQLGTRSSATPDEITEHLIQGRDGQRFRQARTAPVGSNWPSTQLDVPPTPAVVCIRREA